MKRFMLLLFFVPLSLFAHPHIMLKTSLEIEYSNSKCDGIWVEWEFDRFFIPLAKGTYNNLYLSIFDPTYYSAVSYVDDGIKIESGTGQDPRYEVLGNKDYPVYYDPYGSASDMTTYTKWKPGLQIAYPKEVHVYFP